jgi:redox-sensitive bicupin YhaK (pirin superfamily)
MPPNLEAEMPAVTADTLTLPRLTAAALDAIDRPVARVTTAPKGFEGEGFPVHRAFAGVPLTELDPFIMMDQMGEVDYAPGEPKGTPWHPHRGFESVTYLIDGTFLHQDSHGGGGVITDGATQWMTAGSGLLHIETPPESLVVSGGLFHGLQLWVNLPAKDKKLNPAYQGIEGDQITLLASPDGGSLIRLIAGEIDGHKGPGSTHSPITMAHVTLAPGAQVTVPWRQDFNALAYVLSGRGSVGTEGRPLNSGQLAVFGAGDSLTLRAADGGSGSTAGMDVVLLGGRPIGEHVEHYGPFVMNTRAELVQAFEDYQAGRLGVIPPDGLQPFHV